VVGNVYEDPVPLWFRTPALVPAFPLQFTHFPTIVSTFASASGGQAGVIVGFSTNVPSTYEAFVREVGGAVVERFVDTQFKHSRNLRISNLRSGTPYEFVLVLTDEDGNKLIWPEGSEVAKTATGWQIVKIGRTAEGQFSSTFTTAVAPDLTPPVIVDGPTVLARTTNSVTVG